MTEIYCRHCGLRIEYLGDWTNGWVHVLTASVWCDMDSAMRATPA